MAHRCRQMLDDALLSGPVTESSSALARSIWIPAPRNRELMRILFALDACGREIIAWLAIASAGISVEMVRNLMVTAVERRFGTTKVPHPVEWLLDDGSAYIARDTADTGRALGLQLLFTPVRSPRFNGMSAPFGKNPATRLRSRHNPTRRQHHPRLAPQLDGGLLRGPPALWPEGQHGPRVHQA